MRPLTAALAALMLTLPLALPANAESAGRITVTGEGHVAARPDMATVSLGVMTESATAAAAMAANSAKLAGVLEQLRASKIADRDIQTSGLSLNPNWQQNPGDQAARIVGYQATNMLTIRVRALDSLGGLLDKTISDGANSLNMLNFGLADPAPALDEARKLAVADAIARATLLTRAAGVKLGPVLSITEGGSLDGPVPMFRMAATDASPVPVAAGEVDTTASVTMVFGIGE